MYNIGCSFIFERFRNKYSNLNKLNKNKESKGDLPSFKMDVKNGHLQFKM